MLCDSGSSFLFCLVCVVSLNCCISSFRCLCIHLYRLILWHIPSRNPDISAVSGNGYMNASIFYRNFFTGQSTYILSCISSSQIHRSGIVIIIYSDDHTHPIQVTGKSILAVGEHKLCIASIIKSRCILADFSKSSNKSCARIFLHCVSIISKI